MAEVRVDMDEAVAVVTLTAPERRNALTHSMALELLDALDAIDADSAVGAVVVQGDGPVFCAGADRGTLAAAGADPADERAYAAISDIYSSFMRVGSLRAPTVAAVTGAAVGAGLNLALATDLRVVGQGARLMSGFTQLGLHPGGGHVAILARVAGREAAAAMAVFGEAIDGARAGRLGLAWDVVDDDQVRPRALDLARRVATDPELARAVVHSFRTEP